MERFEVMTALLSPTMRSSEETRRAALQRKWEQMRTEDIEIDVEDEDDEELFLTTLQEKLLERIDFLDQSFLVLRAKQINYAAIRLHEALEPKRDGDTNLIQAWTIQPQSSMKIKMNTHIQVLKLSTIFREVRCLRLHQQSGLRTAIEMEIFPSLRSIEVLQTQITALRNVHFFARQLRFLHIEQTDMDELRQILSPQSTDDASSFVVWKCLETLQINCCALLAVDKSVNQLQAVRHMDLGWNRIQSFEVPLETSTLEVLHLCHNKLRDIPPIQSLQRLRELNLSVNKIKSLRGLEALVALEVLDVSHNQIHLMSDVELLVHLKKLKRLVLQHNPIARRPDYRREVLFYLGEGIELDGQPWSASELLSMKKSRRLQSTFEKESAASWGDAPVALSAPTAAHRSPGDEKFVLTYPVLPATKGLTPHLVEICKPASILSPRFRQPQQQQFPVSSSSGMGSRSNSSARMTGVMDDSELSAYQLEDDDEDDVAGGEIFRTVDDFFRTQEDFLVILDTDLVDARVEHAGTTLSLLVSNSLFWY